MSKLLQIATITELCAKNMYEGIKKHRKKRVDDNIYKSVLESMLKKPRTYITTLNIKNSTNIGFPSNSKKSNDFLLNKYSIINSHPHKKVMSVIFPG